MMKKVIFLGEMKIIFGGPYYFDGDTPIVIFNAMISQIKGFRSYISENTFIVYADKTNICKEQVSFFKNFETIKILPVINGSKSKFFSEAFSFITGAAIIGLTWATPFKMFGLMMGSSFLSGGISQLLSPTPYKDDYYNQSLYIFDGAKNLATTGVPIPVVYGRTMVSTLIISQQSSIV